MSIRTLLATPPLRSGMVTIVGDEAHHGRSVLRLAIGHTVRLCDGAGTTATGTVVAVERHSLTIDVPATETSPPTASHELSIALALPKGDRAGDVVRGLTELGVGSIRPLICERGERIPANLERLRRISDEALKQCRRTHRLVIADPIRIDDLPDQGQPLVLLDPLGERAAPTSPRPTTLVIGPEGGLTPTERSFLVAAGARTVRLADHILRIETAALAGTAVWTAIWSTEPT